MSMELESLRKEVNELRERLAIAERQLAGLRQLAPTQTPLQQANSWPVRPLYTLANGVISS